MTMASKQTWDTYLSQNVVHSDEELQSMIKEVVETVHTLERMYGANKASLFVRALVLDYQSLIGMANVRGISYEAL
jgi:hypothetical protein